jgi:ribonuclease R
MVHRLLDFYLNGGNTVAQKDYEHKCKHSTEMEIQAAEAERASVKYKQVQYLSGQLGNVFSAIISGVTQWGIYVELIESKCEGLIRLRDIGDDYYELDEKNYCIRGARTKKVFRLGDQLQVMLNKTDLVKKQIDFLLYEEGKTEKRKSVGGHHRNENKSKKKSGKEHFSKGKKHRR